MARAQTSETEPEKHSAEELSKPAADNTLRRVYKEAKERPKTSPKLVWKELAGVLSCSNTTFWRWATKGGPLAPTDRSALAKYLVQIGAVDPRVDVLDAIARLTEHPLFYGLSLHLDVKLATMNSVATRLKGTYRLWRPSLHMPGWFVRGLLAIEEVDGDYVVATREVHRFSGHDDSIPREAICHGYMLRKNTHYFIVSNDSNTRFLSCTMFDAPFHHSGSDKVVALLGTSLSKYGKFFHAQRVYAERWDGAPEELLKTLDLVARQDVPESVLTKLSDFSSSEFGARF